MPRTRELCLVLGMALALPASAGVPFNQLIAFGASFEDMGQFPDIDFVAVAGLIPPPGAGLDGSTGLRFTNLDPASGERGRAWVERFSDELGIGGLVPSTPLLFPGERTDIPATQNINFAFGGARSADQFQAVVGESVVIHPVDNLVPADLSATSPGFEQRLASGDLSISAKTLFVVNPAGNDVRDATVDNPEADGVQAANNALAIIQRLLDNGARTIISPTFPPLGLLAESNNLNPDGSRSDKAIARTRAADAYNAAMAAGLPALGGNIVVLDFDRLFVEVLEDPRAFGFNPQIDQTTNCYSSAERTITSVQCTEAPGLGKSSGGDPDDFIVNDGLHPTQAAAQILADYASSVLLAPGMIGLLPETALSDARAYLETVANYQARRRWGAQPTGLDLFASVQGGEVDFDEGSSTPAASSDVLDLTLGLALELDSDWFIGFSLGSQNSEVDIDEGGSEFENAALIGTGFLGYRGQHWFADLGLSLGRADLENIDRVVRLGSTMVRRHSGETEADIFGLALGAGADLLSDREKTRLGPFGGLDYLDLAVDGYAEQGTLSTAMVFGDQDRKSLVGSLGVFASHEFPVARAAVEIYGDLSYRHEFEDDSDDVQAVVKNLVPGVRFHMPGYDIDQDSVMLRAGVAADLGALRLVLYGSHEDGDRESTYLGFSLAYDL